jgi:hypothetical protein
MHPTIPAAPEPGFEDKTSAIIVFICAVTHHNFVLPFDGRWNTDTSINIPSKLGIKEIPLAAIAANVSP